ncbi:hypothetical protein Vretimale_15448 [Volvox reticuliferus]|uniref:Uncharacterized protein n=1 Tax=Volvox reticuliferus TaxID=1737510 RepID=A0A8J4LVQ5_9CHLO|nr:hypothetical protein Vretifemale_20424 [Volvox reticuliferus]GIM12061.1 hypothetical protein Vretimale_15448 [Volvox reticuliferus]
MALILHHASLSNQLNRPRRPNSPLHPKLICNIFLRSGVPRHQLFTRATAANQPVPQEAGGSEEEFVGIPPEDDAEVPGTYLDALNPNTKLGKAVRAAVDELNHLNAMEMETLQQCDALLKKLGFKSSIMQAPVQPEESSKDSSQGTSSEL